MPPRQRKLKPASLPPLRDAITRRLLRAIAPALAELVGGPITKPHTRMIARATLSDVLTARASFLELAVQQYKSMTGTGGIKPPPLRDYNAGAWDAALQRTWSVAIRDKQNLTEDDIARALVTADHQGREAERSQLIAYTMHDDLLIGWARVDFRPPTCPFCTMLISRGPVYKSEASAGKTPGADPTEGRNRFHHGDTCSVVLVTKQNRADYPGIEHTRAAEAAWIKASREAGSSAGALERLRETHAFEKANGNQPDGKTKQLADSLTEQQNDAA